MNSVELEKLVQKVTDQVLAELNSNKSVIELDDDQALYPTWFRKIVSADFKCQFNAKQDSNAILLCLSNLSLSDLLAVSNLVGINDRCKKILDYLLKGMPVWVMENESHYLEHKKEQRYAVYSKISNALDEVGKYGVSFISTEEELKKEISIIKRQKHIVVPKHFVTLLEVQKRARAGEQLVNDFEIPTDLAKEWIVKRGDKHEY